MNHRGILVVVSGFSGAGKGTLMKELLRQYPERYALTISATTRSPREGEQDGREYFFKVFRDFLGICAIAQLQHADAVNAFRFIPYIGESPQAHQHVSVGRKSRAYFYEASDHCPLPRNLRPYSALSLKFFGNLAVLRARESVEQDRAVAF